MPTKLTAYILIAMCTNLLRITWRKYCATHHLQDLATCKNEIKNEKISYEIGAGPRDATGDVLHFSVCLNNQLLSHIQQYLTLLVERWWSVWSFCGHAAQITAQRRLRSSIRSCSVRTESVVIIVGSPDMSHYRIWLGSIRYCFSMESFIYCIQLLIFI